MAKITKKQAQEIVEDVVGGIENRMIFPGDMSEADQTLIIAIKDAMSMLLKYFKGVEE